MDIAGACVVEFRYRALANIVSGNDLSSEAVDGKRASELSYCPTPVGTHERSETFFYFALDVARLRDCGERGTPKWTEFPVSRDPFPTD